jgi:4-hydroxy-3-polyprenylbenzoate decarboxylase
VGWSDFREFLAAVEQHGDVRRVENAACDLEIGTLVELMTDREGPMLLFERIQGYPESYRIAAKPYVTPRRSAIALGLPTDVSPFEMFRLWRERVRDYRPVAPVEVSSGPVMENVFEDDRVDLTRFPVPRWHEKDGGPYFGTGCAVITRDPDEDWVNAGTYRCMLHDARTIGVDAAPYHHGNLHMRKWWARGQAAPVAVVVTPDPALFWCASTGLPWGTSEYEYAGFVRGEPLPVLRGPRTGLMLPATAELIVEGEVPPPDVEQRVEGPFGEFTGYYAGGEKMRPVLRVQGLYHRTDPILHGDPPVRPPHDVWGCPPGSTILRVWDGLDKCGIPGIKGVYVPVGGGALTMVVAIKQQYAGHARQVGRVASGLVHTFFRIVIVVDEDIDPSNAEEVLWAVATRSDPETTWETEPECSSNTLDPIIPPDRKKYARGLTNSRALIVACRPWEWMDEFPAVNRASEELRQRTLEKWRSLFDAPAREPVPAGR